MKSRLVIFLLSLHGLVTMGAQAQITVTDDRQQPQRFAQSPQRIVSLLPSLTESVCALQACERLVGVDRYSNWPESVKKLPQVGGGLDFQLEAIARLKPDVVLAAGSSRAADRLAALGIPVLVFEPQNHADVKRTLIEVGKLLGPGRPGGLALWQGIERDLQAAADQVPPAARGAKVYFEVDRTPYAAGQASFIGETLKALGLANIVPASLGSFPKINPEFVVRAQPDVIMLSERHASELPRRPGWAQLRAIREKRICELSAEQGDLVVRPGPRMAAGARVLAQCVAKLMPR
jgi:iron complex transport system substrate-binding protein